MFFMYFFAHVGGLRRKPYFIIGWSIYIFCNLCLALIQTPSVGVLAFFIFFMTLGFVQVRKGKIISMLQNEYV